MSSTQSLCQWCLDALPVDKRPLKYLKDAMDKNWKAHEDAMERATDWLKRYTVIPRPNPRRIPSSFTENEKEA